MEEDALIEGKFLAHTREAFLGWLEEQKAKGSINEDELDIGALFEAIPDDELPEFEKFFSAHLSYRLAVQTPKTDLEMDELYLVALYTCTDSFVRTKIMMQDVLDGSLGGCQI